MVILRSQNKITDSLVILAWDCPFNRNDLEINNIYIPHHSGLGHHNFFSATPSCIKKTPGWGGGHESKLPYYYLDGFRGRHSKHYNNMMVLWETHKHREVSCFFLVCVLLPCIIMLIVWQRGALREINVDTMVSTSSRRDRH